MAGQDPQRPTSSSGRNTAGGNQPGPVSQDPGRPNSSSGRNTPGGNQPRPVTQATKRPGSSGGTPPGPAKGPYLGPEKVAILFFQREEKFQAVPSLEEKRKPGPILDPGTTTALSHCLHVALKLLEMSTGHLAFVKIARMIVNERRQAAAKKQKEKPGSKLESEVGWFKGKDLKDMPSYVNMFLSKVRHDGIPICVCQNLKGEYGLTHKWPVECNDMKEWKTQESVMIYLNKSMIEGITSAANAIDQCMKQRLRIDKTFTEKTAAMAKGRVNDKTKTETLLKEKQTEIAAFEKAHANAVVAFERATFNISSTIAHELVHCFTGFITGAYRPGTPPRVVAGPYGSLPGGTRARGEAGWAWCEETFGGLLYFYYTAGEPKESDQIGFPAIVEWKGDHKSSLYCRVDHNIVKKIISLDFSGDNTNPDWMKSIKSANHPKVSSKDWNSEYKSITKIWDNGCVIPDVDSVTQVQVAFQIDQAYAKALEVVHMTIKDPLNYKMLVG